MFLCSSCNILKIILMFIEKFTLLSLSLQAPYLSIRMTNGFIDKEKQSGLLLALAILKVSAPIDE